MFNGDYVTCDRCGGRREHDIQTGELGLCDTCDVGYGETLKPEPQLCGQCQLPIEDGEPDLLYYGKKIAHLGYRCITLLRRQLDEANAKGGKEPPTRRDWIIPMPLVGGMYQSYEKGLRDGKNSMLHQVRQSLKGYPEGLGDLVIMERIDRIVRHAVSTALSQPVIITEGTGHTPDPECLARFEKARSEEFMEAFKNHQEALDSLKAANKRFKEYLGNLKRGLHTPADEESTK